eukprot:g20074.t1
MSSGGASSSPSRKFDLKDQPASCAECKSVIPPRTTVEAIPPRTFLSGGWKGLRCVPSCSVPVPSTPPRGSQSASKDGAGASSGQLREDRRRGGGKRGTRGSKRVARPESHDEMMRVEVKQENTNSSFRASAVTPASLDMGGGLKRPHSFLEDDGGSGSGSDADSKKSAKPSSPDNKKLRTDDASPGSNTSPSSSLSSPPALSRLGPRCATTEDAAAAAAARGRDGTRCNLAQAMASEQGIPSNTPAPVQGGASATQGTRNKVPAARPPPATPVASPAPLTPAPANGGGGEDDRVSVSQIFRERNDESYNVETAKKVVQLARRMYNQAGDRPEGEVLQRRFALDDNGDKIPCRFPPWFLMENAYPRRCRNLLEDAFDTAVLN